MRKIAIIVVTVLLIFVAVALLFFRHTPFQYSGVVEAVEISVPARLNDTISKLNINEGTLVTAGMVMAELECHDTRIKADIAAKEFTRAAQLLKSAAGSRENYDLRKNQYEQTQLYKSWCEITSPIEGKVLYKFYEEGEFISAGRKLATVADLREVDVWVYVEHNLLANLSVGENVNGHLPEAGQDYEGIILTINDEAEFTPKNVQTRKERERLVYGVKTRFKNDEKQTLKPGMTLEITFAEKE